MSKVNSFKTITEKERAFKRIVVSDFDSLISKLAQYSKEGSFFRGQADASWKLYTFSQREWITKDLKFKFRDYKSYETMKLAFIKSNEHARLKACTKIINDVSSYSCLQHYGCPTPLLDFTSSYDNALYFATCDNIGYGDLETNSFISIYVIFEGGSSRTPFNDLTSFGSVIESYRKQMAVVIEENGPIPRTDFTEALNYDLWKDFQILLMKETEDFYMQIANPRSELQNGVFVAINSENKPFDEYCNGNVERLENGYSSELALPKITCIDIHKSLKSQIMKYLESKNVNKRSLGLDGNEWGKAAHEKFLEAV